MFLKTAFLKRKKKYEYSELKMISGRVILVKPLTYMNLSGSLFPSIFSDFYMCIKNLLVVLDNVDLPWENAGLKSEVVCLLIMVLDRFQVFLEALTIVDFILGLEAILCVI